jgi:hypothetical protein
MFRQPALTRPDVRFVEADGRSITSVVNNASNVRTI